MSRPLTTGELVRVLSELDSDSIPQISDMLGRTWPIRAVTISLDRRPILQQHPMNNKAPRPMKLEHTACFAVDLSASAKEKDQLSPQQVDKLIRPVVYRRRQWIPQTICDRVWIWYEFETREKRDEYIQALPQNMRHYLDTTFDQSDLDYWSKV